ncbi:hypothetical protein Hanom_Chr05g00412481 [Helianthus anomalus]
MGQVFSKLFNVFLGNSEMRGEGEYDDYYKRAIYPKTGENTSGESLKKIARGSSKEKSQALVSVNDHAKHRTIQDDEGFNWGD